MDVGEREREREREMMLLAHRFRRELSLEKEQSGRGTPWRGRKADTCDKARWRGWPVSGG